MKVRAREMEQKLKPKTPVNTDQADQTAIESEISECEDPAVYVKRKPGYTILTSPCFGSQFKLPTNVRLKTSVQGLKDLKHVEK